MLSVCLITKNEEKNITRCLKSIEDIADEIIMVDTGSTDNTIELASKFNIKLYHSQWDNDFSKARNASLDKATKKWILFLDADEELDALDKQNLMQLLKNNPQFEGLYFKLVNIVDNQIISSSIVFRLFKNNVKYRFTGKMHEQIIASVTKEKGIGCVLNSNLKIYHYGYDPKTADINVKSDRNLNILHSYDEKDKDGYYYYALGNEYARLNRNDDALKYYQKSLDNTNIKVFNPIYYPYLMLNILKVLRNENRYLDTLNYIKDFKKYNEDFRDLYFFEYMTNLDCYKFTRSKNSLLKYISCNNSKFTSYPCNHFDTQHNISSLLEDVNKFSIPHTDNILSTLIFIDEIRDILPDFTRHLNEISQDILLVIPQDINKESNTELKKAQQFGAKILSYEDNEKNEVFAKAQKMLRSKYILLLDSYEILPQNSQRELMTLLCDTKEYAFSLDFLNTKTNVHSQKFCIFKNHKKVKSLKEYENYLECKNKEINNSNILIYIKEE